MDISEAAGCRAEKIVRPCGCHGVKGSNAVPVADDNNQLHPTGHNHPSPCCPLHVKLSLKDADIKTLPCFQRSHMKGLDTVNGKKGKLMLEQAMKMNKVEYGKEIGKDLFNNHFYISVDLGVISEMSIVFIWAKCDEKGDFELIFVSKQISSVSKYSGSGIDYYLNEKQDALVHLKDQMEALSKIDRRTIDPGLYQDFRKEFLKEGSKIIEFNYEQEELERKRKLENRKKSHWSTIANIILAFIDAMEQKYGKKIGNPIIVMGIPTFKATMKGKRACAPKKTVEYVSRFFTLVMIGEYLTSQRCPQCLAFLRKKFDHSTRIWECPCCKVSPPNLPDEQAPFVVNKDISAALNIFLIYASLIWTGERPLAFQPRKDALQATKSKMKRNRDKKEVTEIDGMISFLSILSCLFFVLFRKWMLDPVIMTSFNTNRQSKIKKP